MIEAKKKAAKGPTEEEKAAQEKNEMKKYSELVATSADEYHKEITDKEKEAKEAHQYDGLDEEAMVQLKSQVKSHGFLDADELAKSGLSNEQIAYLTEMTNAADLPAVDALFT